MLRSLKKGAAVLWSGQKNICIHLPNESALRTPRASILWNTSTKRGL